ncbi:unnamed protein product [Dicrocoelium dendriticum]|nr:unnamed protein product [Dicrocoelium dendriticum]
MPVSWANDTLRYSTFAFLYGTIPTAPPVYLFAAEYGVMEVVTGVGLVFGTFLCAPMMFILARTVTMYLAEPSQYDHLLGNTITGVSWLSVAGCILTAAVLFLTRKAFRIPHRFTLCYIGCVLLSCLGIIAGYLLNRRDHTSDLHIWREHALDKPANWLNCLQFTIFFLGCTGARFWMTLIAFSLFLQRFRSVCFVLRHQTWIYLVGFALPAIVTSVLLLASSWHIVNDVDPAFQYGRNQLIIALIVLLLNTFATTFFLIWYIRLGPTTNDKSSLDQHSSPLAQHSESSGEHDSSGSDAASAARLRNDKVSDHQDSGEVHRRSLTSSSNVCSCHCITLESRRQCNRIIRYARLLYATVADAAHFSVAALTDTMDAEKTAHQFVTYHLVTCSNCIAVDVVSGTSVIKMFSEDSLKQWLSNSGLVVSDADGAMYINALKSTRVIGEVCPNESIRARHFSDVTSDRLLYFVNASSVEPETNSV